MEAIVLAGGLGTRLRDVVKDLPKPMAPVRGKPFLEFILSYLEKNGIKRVILSVGYKWELIHDFFGNRFRAMDLIYSVEDEPLGTGGAIQKAMTKVSGEKFYIVNGDTFFNIDLKELELVKDSRLMLTLKKMKDFERYGCVETDGEGFVTAFREKQYRESGHINGGLYLASHTLFEGFQLSHRFSFEEFMEIHFKVLKISTKVFESYFIDIGIPSDYQRAQSELEKFL